MHSFADFLRSGWYINMSVAIDYTASNGDPQDPESFHYLNDEIDKLNQYESAMKQVGNVLDYYAYKNKYYAYGFGGRPLFMEEDPKSSQGVSVERQNCFPLNGNLKNPAIHGLDNLICTYRESLEGVELWGPTFFAPVITQVYDIVAEQERQNKKMYHVLLILTDGGIHDMRQTIQAVVKASSKPLSIIIVGIGDGPFDNMDILDADESVLVDSECTPMARDIV